MRRTPLDAVHLQAQPVVQTLVALIAALALGGLAVAAIGHQPLAWPVMLAAPLGAACAWRAAAVLPRRLRWDGQAWWLAEPGAAEETPVQLTVPIDLDTWLLLRASPGPRWLPLSRRQQQAQWTALRATLFSASRAPR